MKILLLNVLLVGLGFLNATNAQTTPSSAAWALTDTTGGKTGTGKTSITTGQVMAGYESLSGSNINAYTALNNSQRTRITTGNWPALQKTQIDSVYLQFAVSPKPGNKFNVDSVAMSVCGNSSNNMRANIYYSIDPTFATKTAISYSTGLTRNQLGTTTQFRVKASAINVNVNPGQSFYVRVYFWNDSVAAASGKYLGLQNVIIGGSTTSVPVASSIIWPCSTDLSSAITGPMVAGTPTFGSPLVRYSQNLAYGGVTGVSFYTNAVWQPETAPAEGRYMQFTASPKTGGTMVIDSVTLKMAAWATNDFRVSIYYSKDPNFTLATGTSLAQGVAVTNGAFSKTKAIVGLTVNSGETMYLRLYPYHLSLSGDKNKLVGVNDVSIFGAVTGVTADPATVTTNTISYISSTFATSGGNIPSDGGAAVTERGVVWNTATAPTTANNKTTSGTGSGAYSLQVKGLTPSTTYYLRAYAINSTGTAYGNEQTFTTLAAIVVPTVTKTAASSILVTSVKAGGNATAWGGDTIKAKGVCWNTTGLPTISNNKTVNGTDLGSFTSTIYPLVQNTKYYFRAYATNSAGTGYSVVDSFTTQVPAADVTKTVAKDGSGDYTTVQAAFNAVPLNYTGKYTIVVKPGTYYEKDTLVAGKVNVTLKSIHPDSTIITYDAFADSPKPGGGTMGTSGCQTMAIDADDFTAINITFQNTKKNIGAGNLQAVALRTNGDRQSYYNCKIMGYQDTYYAWGGSYVGRIYMKNCYLEGSVDYIFGRDVVVFDSCEMFTNRQGGAICAPSTDAASKYGFVFMNSNVTSLKAGEIGFDGNAMVGFYLGRPWQSSPQCVYLKCNEPATLYPTGWTFMSVNPLLFAEYKCFGAGSDISARSTVATSASRQLSDAEALNYTTANIFKTSTNSSFGYDWMPDMTIYKFKQTTGLGTLAAKKYGDAPVKVKSSSNLPVVVSSSAAKIATIKGDTIVIKGAGTTTIKAIQAGNYLYSAAADSVKTLVVAKADLTVKADDMTRKRTEANPAFTITYTGFVNGDTKDSITVPTISCTADASSPTGTYPIILTGGAAANYNITKTNGTLTITSGTAVSSIKTFQVEIYPNPASNILKIKRASSTPETLTIFDTFGSKVIERKLVSDLEEVDITGLSHGTYILRLEGMIYKIIVQ